MSVLRVEALRYGVRRHFWTRRSEILRGVELAVNAGEIFGFLGPNGAGKTTTIKALLGLIHPDAGRIELLGASPEMHAVRRRIGYMPEHAYFPEHLTARELLSEHGLLAGLGWRTARQRATEILERVGLAGAADRRLGTYSKGMLQRAGLGQALIGDPDLVVLDEPMSGLDPLGRRDIREIMLELRERGKTVFFSTHILPDVEAICDRVGIIANGRSQKSGRLAELVGDTEAGVDVTCAGCSEAAREAGAAHADGHETHGDVTLFRAADAQAANRIVDALRQQDTLVRSVQPRSRSLEDLFIDAAAGDGEVSE